MYRRYLVLVIVLCLLLIGLSVANIMMLADHPSRSEVKELIKTEEQRFFNQAISDYQSRITPTPQVSPAPKGRDGANGTSGKDGKDGKDGLTIVGPKGEPGEPGAPGREVELALDPETGDLYMRYTGDTAWRLVEPVQ